MGGSDQWGNIVNGVELNRRVNINNTDTQLLYGLTSPLITTSSGNKMGKTTNGAVWLNKNLCSSWDYWQFWRNTEDKDVIKFIKLFTEINLKEITKLEKLKGAEINEAKIILANSATTMLHGKEATDQAINTSKNIFQNQSSKTNLPSIEYKNNELIKGVPILECFIKNNYLVKSKSDARRLIRGGGAKLNNVTIVDENYKLTSKEFKKSNKIKLSAGKKKHILIVKI